MEIEATKYAIGETDLSDVTVTTGVVNDQLDIEADVSDDGAFGAFGGRLEAPAVEMTEGTRVSTVEIDDGEGEMADVAGDVTVDVDDGTIEMSESMTESCE